VVSGGIMFRLMPGQEPVGADDGIACVPSFHSAFQLMFFIRYGNDPRGAMSICIERKIIAQYIT